MKTSFFSSVYYFGLSVFLILFLVTVNLKGQDEEVLLWPHNAPGSENVHLKEIVTERSGDPGIQNRIVKNISSPEIQVFNPANPNGTAVLICPGGIYIYQAFDKEGTDIARWLNNLGITAFILRYRLPSEGHEQGKLAPVRDAQRAMRLIRSDAEKWDVDPDKTGIMGFSAGGHLAATLTVYSDTLLYPAVDSIDRISCRPDFMMLLYPVISMADSITHKDSRDRLLGKEPSAQDIEFFSVDLHVSPACPPAFIALSANDPSVSPQNGKAMYQALINSGVDAELSLLQGAEHGFGMRSTDKEIAGWTDLCEKWLYKKGLLTK